VPVCFICFKAAKIAAKIADVILMYLCNVINVEMSRCWRVAVGNIMRDLLHVFCEIAYKESFVKSVFAMKPLGFFVKIPLD